MSVATRNPFALLDQESESPPSPPPPPESAPAPQTSAPPKRAKVGPASRGGKYYARGGARPNADREQPSDDPPVAPEAKQRRFDGERREGRGRGRGSNRGSRGRTYDKHSATGKTDSDKKLHNGWGGDDGNTELKVEEAATVDAAAESAVVNDWGAPAEADASAGGWDAPAPDAAGDQSSPDADKTETPRRKDRDQEEEDNTLTLDQYLAQQKEKELGLLPKLETRKANDGQDGIWDGVTLLEKGESESYFSGKTKSAPKARIERKEKVFIEIEARFERPSRGGRGGRGGIRGGDRAEDGGRGGRGRGSGSGRGRRGAGNGTAAAVNVDDEAAFPSLS